MKKCLSFCLLVLVLLSAVSCRQKEYSNHIDTDGLSDAAILALPKDTAYTEADDDYLDIYLPEDDDFIREHTVCYATDGNKLDEFGIFHVSAENIKTAEAYLKQYLTESYTQNQAFYDSYIPQETPKLKNAEVRTFGNYVTYAILSDQNRETFFATMENTLKK